MARKISILIVDDEDSVRDSLYSWFIEDGYAVECA
jgi:FixJ family two-component response regulator